LTYLKYLPVTHLKIDMDFVRGLAHSRTTWASCLRSSTSPAAKTVAGGVVDADALEVLRSSGVALRRASTSRARSRASAGSGGRRL